MTEVLNQGWQLARRPVEGWPVEDDFKRFEAKLPVPAANQMLTRTIYLSLDPYQWGRRRSGVEKPGEVCHGRTVSQVVTSNLRGYAPGDFLFNTNGWQAYGLTGDGISVFNYMLPRKIDPSAAPISTAIGVLGMLGLTAYAGAQVQCQPRHGETMVVSAASGGVGQVAGQIAKIAGCRVVGVAGSQEKCDFTVNELGFDACVSHLAEDYVDQLRLACPDGVDMYFENVGGKVFAGVLPLFNRNARITLCGMISQYGNTDGRDSRDLWNELGAATFARQTVTVHGLFVGNYVADYQAEFLAKMAGWIKQGLVKYKEDVWPGLDKAPAAFTAMLKGGNFGKTIVQVGNDPTQRS